MHVEIVNVHGYRHTYDIHCMKSHSALGTCMKSFARVDSRFGYTTGLLSMLCRVCRVVACVCGFRGLGV